MQSGTCVLTHEALNPWGSRLPSLNDGEDQGRNIVRFFVFPEPQNSPPEKREPFACHQIALDVARNLGSPVVDVGARLDVMDRAAMPETAVNIDSNFLFGENDVGLAAPINLVGSIVDSVSELGAMEAALDGKLWCCVAATLSNRT